MSAIRYTEVGGGQTGIWSTCAATSTRTVGRNHQPTQLDLMMMKM